MTPRRNPLGRLSRPLRIVIQIGILAVIVLAVGTVGFVEYSAQPSFCDNCHIMEPYYQSWATSSHNDVPCIKCHYAPGVKAEAMGKLQAANQVVKYITATYGSKPWAEIEDAACLRGGCHSERKLEASVTFEGVRFNHKEHLGELRRGKQLRCTSCHSQIVQGQHLTVTQSTCFLCHFKDRPPGEPIAGCKGCHPSPPVVLSPAGFVVDHPQYVEDLTSCVSCHDNLTEGNGTVNRDRCFQCHNQPARLEQYENVTLLHQTHIAEHNVECAQCHDPIEHRVVSLTTTVSQMDCQGCHAGTHQAEQQLYAGIGGHATERTPSSMYLARVACSSCHALSDTIAGHEGVERAGEATCLSCHGTRYAGILSAWQQGIQSRLSRATEIVHGARSAVPRGPAGTRSGADSLFALAEHNLDLVRQGKGVHNVAYSDRLLRSAVDLASQAVQASGTRYRVPEFAMSSPAENECLQCHLGVEGQRGSYRGVAFPHGPHVSQAGLACTECHSGMDAHGNITLQGPGSCESCHHAKASPGSCERCHAGNVGAPTGTISTATGSFSHSLHLTAGIGCAGCHAGPSMQTKKDLCESCHARHHTPTVTCLGCHRGGVKDIHDATAHGGCSDCHGDAVAALTFWSREVCTVCHVDRVDHHAPKACQECHRIPPLGGAGSGGR